MRAVVPGACPAWSLAELLCGARRPWLADGPDWRSGRDILRSASRYQVPALRGALVLVPAATAFQALAGAVAVEDAGGVPVLWPARAGVPGYAATLPRLDHARAAIEGRPGRRWNGPGPAIGVSSGGTSGAGKIVLLEVSRAVQNAAAVAERVGTGSPLRVASLRSPAFSAGLVCDIVGALLAGDQVAAIPVSSVLLGIRALLRHRPDAVHCAPTVLGEVLHLLPPVRRFVVSGETLTAAALGRLRESQPSALIMNGYGLSEAGPRVSVGPAEPRRDGTGCGVPLPGVTVRAGPDGGLVVTTPYACAAVLDAAGMTGPGQEIPTGDTGRTDPDGTVIVIGRAGDVVTVCGCAVSIAALAADLRSVAPSAEVWLDAAGSVIIGVPAAPGGEQAELRRRLAARLRTCWPMLSRVQWRRAAAAPRTGPRITEAGKSRPGPVAASTEAGAR